MADTFPVPVVEPAVEPVAPSLPFLTYDKDEFETDVSLFGGDTSAFTSSMVEVLAEDFPEQPDYMTYSGLRDGTAPILDTIPELAGLSPAERRLSDNDIIEFFARDLEGEPIQAGTFLGGAKREAIPAVASVPTFMGGFALGQTAVAGVPPVGPAAVLRFGLPFVTGTIGAGLGYFVGEQVNDAIQGEESPILPGTAAAYEAGKTAAGAFAWLPMPYMVPKQINFGVELAENLVKEGKKAPLSLKIARGLESTVGRTGAQARANPLKFAAAETLAAAGATGGAYAVESSDLEGSTAARITGELAGGVSAVLLGNLFAKRLPTTFGALRGGIWSR